MPDDASTLIADRRDFIRSQTRLHPVPHVPEISLFVADEALDIWEKTEEQLGAMGMPPPFWAFAWAGGQALARYVLDHPKLVAGKNVLDFAAGSGLVAIAAAMAGAKSVLASEIDLFACDAIAINAAQNGVAVTVSGDDLTASDGSRFDIILAGDVFYEKPMSARVFDWLQDAHGRGTIVLIGDPGRSYLPRDQLQALAEYTVPVARSLEDAEIKRTTVWQIAPSGDGSIGSR